MKDKLYHLQKNVYSTIIILTWCLYIIIILGLSTVAPKYLIQIQNLSKIYFSLFLIYRFNPLKNIEFTDLDGKIAFSAGLFLLMTTAVSTMITEGIIKIADKSPTLKKRLEEVNLTTDDEQTSNLIL
jgi:hypothetical protein